MTATEQIITIGILILGVASTRFFSFIAFPSERHTPRFVHYLSHCLPSAVFGMLVVYCIKDIHPLSGNHGLPETIGIVICVILHLWRRNMMFTCAGGTIIYMIVKQVLLN